jgi:hypothetical protein
MTPPSHPVVVEHPPSGPSGKGWVRTLGAKVLRLLGRLAWRYRSELAPLGAGAALFVGSATLHLTGPQWWWTALPAGAVLVSTTATWTIHPRRNRPVRRRDHERRWIALIGTAATVWLAAAWRSGAGVLPLWAFGLGVIAASCPWWWHRRRRSKLSRRVENWECHAKAAKLPHTEVQSAEYGEGGYALRLALHGHTVEEVRRNLGRLAMTLRARPGSVRVEAEPRDAGRCVVHVDEAEPDVPSWHHMGQPVERVRADRVYVEPLDELEPPAIVDGVPWRPELVLSGNEPAEETAAAATEAAEDPLTVALRAAPSGGLSREELLVATGFAPSTLTRRLGRLREEGTAQQVAHGRWRSVEPAEEATS